MSIRTLHATVSHFAPNRIWPAMSDQAVYNTTATLFLKRQQPDNVWPNPVKHRQTHGLQKRAIAQLYPATLYNTHNNLFARKQMSVHV